MIRVLLEPSEAQAKMLSDTSQAFTSAFNQAVEIGWRLAREHWGKGYAVEAAQTVCRHAFENLNLQEIVSYVTPINHASIRVMEKLGMTCNKDEQFLHPSMPPNDPMALMSLYRLQKN